MSDPAPKRTKLSQQESDLSQVLAHGPAYCEAYGRCLGAILMVFAIGKTRRGSMGIAATTGVIATVFYNIFWK